MADIQDKVVTVEALQALSDYDAETYSTKTELATETENRKTAISNIVKVSSTEPTDDGTQIWISSDDGDEVEVPTMEDLNKVIADLNQVSTDLDATEGDLSDTNTTLNQLKDKHIYWNDVASFQTLSNRAFRNNGTLCTLTGNTILKYAVTAGDELYLKLAEPLTNSAYANQPTYIFSDDSVTSTSDTSHIVGDLVTGVVDARVIVPDGASYLFVSKNRDATNNIIQKAYWKTDSDTTLSYSGLFADSKTVGDKFGDIVEDTEIPFDTFTTGAYVNTSGTNDSTTFETETDEDGNVNLVLTTNTSYATTTVSVKEGDRFVVSGSGGDAPRLWCFADGNYLKKISAPSETTAVRAKITAPCDGYLIVNMRKAATYKKYLARITDTSVEESLGIINESISATNQTIEELHIAPTVKFDLDHELKDVSAQRALIDWSASSKSLTLYDISETEDGTLSLTSSQLTCVPFYHILEQVQSLFNKLCVDYPDYVTRVDAVSEAGLTYPDYANGITEETTVDGVTYEPTIAYKTYMYKFTSYNKNAGNGTYCPKKKALIISGVHGMETAAPFNAYLFAEQLCKCDDANFFKFRSAYDVYIIPCVNGYGMHHDDRRNARMVDVNRNYPVEKWKEVNKGGTNYSGASAMSEFETQLVVNLTKAIEPDLAVDHHNYFEDTRQFFTAVSQESQTKLAHQGLVDCSYTFIKNYPEFFGDYKLLIDPTANYEYAPRMIAKSTNGTAVRWWYEAGVKLSTTIEICDRVRYTGGKVLVPTSQTNYDPTYEVQGSLDFHTKDETAFSLAEYTFRNLIFRYAQWVLEN